MSQKVFDLLKKRTCDISCARPVEKLEVVVAGVLFSLKGFVNGVKLVAVALDLV